MARAFTKLWRNLGLLSSFSPPTIPTQYPDTMTSRATRTNPPAVSSYLEVDSDVDMDSEDERITNAKIKARSYVNEEGSSKDVEEGMKIGDSFGAGEL